MTKSQALFLPQRCLKSSTRTKLCYTFHIFRPDVVRTFFSYIPIISTEPNIDREGNPTKFGFHAATLSLLLLLSLLLTNVAYRDHIATTVGFDWNSVSFKVASAATTGVLPRTIRNKIKEFRKDLPVYDCSCSPLG